MKGKITTRTTLFIFIIASIAVFLMGCAGGSKSASTTSEKVFRFAYTKSISPASLARERGTLEKKLAAKGIKLKWVEFQTGPQMFEAINANSVDFINSGNMPAVYAQANNTPFVYVAGVTGPTYSLLVPKDSSIRRLADLKGKKIAFPKGSVSEYMLYKVLEKAGLKKDQVEAQSLLPSDSMTAFQGGKIDAWIIWEPYTTMVEEKLQGKVLLDSTDLIPHLGFYHASRDYAEKNKEIIDLVVQDLKENGEWMTANPKEAARIIAKQTGIEAAIYEKVIAKAKNEIVPLDAQVIAEQQKFSEGMLQQGFIKKPVKMEDFLLWTDW